MMRLNIWTTLMKQKMTDVILRSLEDINWENWDVTIENDPKSGKSRLSKAPAVYDEMRFVISSPKVLWITISVYVNEDVTVKLRYPFWSEVYKRADLMLKYHAKNAVKERRDELWEMVKAVREKLV